MDFGRLGVLRWCSGGLPAAAVTMGGSEPAAAATAGTVTAAEPATPADAARERFTIKKSYSIEVGPLHLTSCYSWVVICE